MVNLLNNLIKLNIIGCARCGETHYELEFRKMTNPIEDSDGTVWDYWAPCPTNNGEPILLNISPSAMEEK